MFRRLGVAHPALLPPPRADGCNHKDLRPSEKPPALTTETPIPERLAGSVPESVVLTEWNSVAS